MPGSSFQPDKLRQVTYILVILLLGLLLFLELQTFIPAFLGAVTLYILMRRWLHYFTEKKHWKKWMAMTVLLVGSAIVILMPIGLLINMFSSKVSYAISNSARLLEAVRTFISETQQRLNVTIVSQDTLSKMGERMAEQIPKVLDATFNTVTTIFFMYFILYFMLSESRRMEKTLYEYLPMKDENARVIGKEVNNMVVSNAIGIPLVAIVQGIAGLIGYFIAGLADPWFWFAATCITAMIPVVGAALVYAPLSVLLFTQGKEWQGIFMLIWGFGVIGSVDNIFRFALQKRIGNIHPLITVFGVIIGVKLFGFIGLIFGPLLISMFIVLVRIYSKEFIVKQRELPDEGQA